MIQMQVAVETQSGALADLAKVSGVSAEQFSASWKHSPAEAIQSFLVGLSKMSEEGVSAIATLDEMGIKEVRLRDTFMRATNASELFSKAVATSNKAWTENTALTKEASTRYGTMRSQFDILKNKASLFAQTLGDDLTPSAKKLMNGLDDLMDAFMNMDRAQRESLIRTGIGIAAIGPAFTILGKATTTIGKVTGSFGKFATAVGEAGGGFKGFAQVVGSSKLAVAGLIAALGVGIYLLHDWASGAKAVREALQGMQATADKWRDTQTNTVYNNEGLGFFGMSKESFAASAQTVEQWFSNLTTIWSDGKKETDEMVSDMSQSFSSLTANTCNALAQFRQTAMDSGNTSLVDTIQTDMDELDKINDRVAQLLKKRQNKKLSDQDKIELQELIDAKGAIEIKYKLSPEATGGYEQIIQGVEAEVARAQARGQKGADSSVYEAGLTATAQGYAAITAEVNKRYDAEFALLQLIEDETEREKARSDLDAKYNTDRQQAASDYASAMQKVISPMWEQDGIQQAT